MRFFAEQFIPTIIFLAAGGYYTIELAGSRIRLVALNMNLYMEDIMDEMKFRRTHLRRRGGVRGAGVLKGEDPSLEAVTDADPMGQWAWLSNVMETATKKRQNVSSLREVFRVHMYESSSAIRRVLLRPFAMEFILQVYSLSHHSILVQFRPKNEIMSWKPPPKKDKM